MERNEDSKERRPEELNEKLKRILVRKGVRTALAGGLSLGLDDLLELDDIADIQDVLDITDAADSDKLT